jgi:hypothetical protein
MEEIEGIEELKVEATVPIAAGKLRSPSSFDGCAVCQP